jgi:hypothetical protein
VESLAGVFVRDGDLGALHDSTAGVRQSSLNTSGGGGALRKKRSRHPENENRNYDKWDQE